MNYSYDDGAWGDQLTGTTYDEIGNPDTYNGYDLTWNGRQLMEMSMNAGQFRYSFTYNDEGIRTSKTYGSTTHYYTLNGSQIVTETWVTKTQDGEEIVEHPNHFLVYLYDESGAPIGLQYRNKTYEKYDFDTYYFEKNLQGDIIAIYTEAGTKIGSYTYDAWGNCTCSYATGATPTQKKIVQMFNPFRYRGYYYDYDTGLYYLQSRYYNPTTGRFINADGYVNTNGDLIGYNMYAYCSNNPVMGYDPTGYICWWGVLAGVALTVAGVAIAVASYGVGSPVGAALMLQGGALIAATGIVTTECAVTEATMVIDISTSTSEGRKMGGSLVIDFEDETFDLYGHDGMTASTPNGSPITYSVGFVFNYDNIGDYGGPFINCGGSYRWFGIDYCRSPDLDPASTSAMSFTFGLPGTSKVSGYVGWDNYYHIGAWGGN